MQWQKGDEKEKRRKGDGKEMNERRGRGGGGEIILGDTPECKGRGCGKGER